MKEALINYIKKNKIQKLTIIGHSMGGNLAIDLAAEFPDEIIKIVLKRKKSINIKKLNYNLHSSS